MDARDLARLSIETRRDDTLKTFEARLAKSLSSTYGGINSIKELGAAGAVPAANRQKSSNLSVGEPIGTAQRLLESASTSANEQELRELIDQVLQILREDSNRRGILLYQGDETNNPNNDPNDADNDGEGRAYQLYDRQLVYTGTKDRSGALYYHQPAIGGVDDEFIPAAAVEELLGEIDVPELSRAYNLCLSARYDSKIISYSLEAAGAAKLETSVDGTTEVTSGNTTVQFNVAVGGVLGKGQRLTLTPTAISEATFAFVVETIRL